MMITSGYVAEDCERVEGIEMTESTKSSGRNENKFWENPTQHEQELINERGCSALFSRWYVGSLEYELIVDEVHHIKSRSFDKETILLDCPSLEKQITERQSI